MDIPLRRWCSRIVAGDTGRHSLASIAALVIAGIAASIIYGAELWAGGARGADGGGDSGVAPFLGTYLIFWISYGTLFCALTHIVCRRMDSARFLRLSAEQGRRTPRLWERWVGNESAESLTMSGALLSAAFVIVLAQSGELRESGLNLFLGLGGVAASWALMVYSFAGTYARRHALGEKIEFPFPEPPVFGDFLSHSVFVSTFLGPQARASARGVLVSMRAHAVLAFVFNAVIVAMTVSILFGTLVS